jgi:hypothetical protein
MMIEQMAREYFPNGFPEKSEQWLDFAEHVAEAQHRKTWALAMEHAATCCSTHSGLNWPSQGQHAIGLLPCPPIEATKDK